MQKIVTMIKIWSHKLEAERKLNPALSQSAWTKYFGMHGYVYAQRFIFYHIESVALSFLGWNGISTSIIITVIVQ